MPLNYCSAGAPLVTFLLGATLLRLKYGLGGCIVAGAAALTLLAWQDPTGIEWLDVVLGKTALCRSSPTTLLEVVTFASPLLYVAFVEVVRSPVVVPFYPLLLKAESVHNIGLAFLSATMLYGIILCCVESRKLHSLHALCCIPFRETQLFHVTAHAFFWSKLWEWIDSALLLAKGKKLSWLHYTHHASTAILTGINMLPTYSSLWSVAVATNSFVHFWMYSYYAFPVSLRWSKRLLTQSQIVQHVCVLGTVLYVIHTLLLTKRPCHSLLMPNLVAVALYMMYLLFFLAFYAKTNKGGGYSRVAKAKADANGKSA